MLLVLLLVISTHIFGADFQSLENSATQQLYEAALMEVSNNTQINIKCKKISKALNAGADLKKVQNKLNPTHDLLMATVVGSQNEKLLKRCLRRNANVKVKWHGLSILALAQKYSMVKLLLMRGAHTDLTEQQKHTTFARIMDDHYDFELIKLYKKYDFKATSIDDLLGWTLLMELALFPGSDMIPKAKLLLKGLNHGQIRGLIELKNNKLHTVFDIINNKKLVCTRAMNDKSKANCIYLDAYQTFLEEQVAECSICYTDLATEKSVLTLCCKQPLHDSCLTQWVYSAENKNVCPFCRNIKPY